MILVGAATIFAALVALIPLKTRLPSRIHTRTGAPPEVISAASSQADSPGTDREASDAELLRVALAAFSVHRMHRARTVTPPRSSGWATPRRMRQSAPFRKQPSSARKDFYRSVPGR
jgi:hypothetical protein